MIFAVFKLQFLDHIFSKQPRFSSTLLFLHVLLGASMHDAVEAASKHADIIRRILRNHCA